MPTVGRPARILVVETDERELKALRTVLELEGYEVAGVSTAQKALAAAREMDWPDTIVADSRLPDGIGGAELIERLRTEAARAFNAILLTVNPRPGELAQIDAAKIRHLRKPVLPKELLRVLAENLASTSWGAAPQRHATEVIHLIEPRAGERELLSKMLSSWGVVAQPFDSAESFLATAEPSEGGCVLVDIALPGIGGLELLHEMAGAIGGPPVVVIVGHDNAMAAAQALKNGAFDILERPFQEEAVRDVVTRAVQSARASRALSNEAERHRLLFSTLTEREQEVVRHIVSGAANKEIAYRLAISERTVEGHRARAMAKLDARSVQDLVRMASGLRVYPI
jgi:two-component system CheB/CheR fusion protein